MSVDAKRGPRQSAFVRYFADLWAGIYSTFQGMRLTLHYFWTTPITMEYPEQRPVIPESHRGLHEYNEEICTVCKQCASVCPVDCIDIESVGKGKDLLALRFEIDYGRCLFCNLCAEACKPSALTLGKEYDLASGLREGVRRNLARPKSQEEIADVEARVAAKAAARAAEAKAKAAAKAAADGEAAQETPKEGADS